MIIRKTVNINAHNCANDFSSVHKNAIHFSSVDFDDLDHKSDVVDNLVHKYGNQVQDTAGPSEVGLFHIHGNHFVNDVINNYPSCPNQHLSHNHKLNPTYDYNFFGNITTSFNYAGFLIEYIYFLKGQQLLNSVS